eukprot:g40792.t1
MRQQNYTTYTHTKNRKLEKLGIATSYNQVCLVPQLKVDGTTAGKSIINLSDHTVQPDEIEILSGGLNFYPTTNMDPTGLTADIEEFIRRMRLQEFFQDVSSEPNETNNEPDQSTERSMVESAKMESDWTPPRGHCPGFDRYAQAIRESINAKFISCTLRVVQNVTQEQRNTIHDLKTNCNIVSKPADEDKCTQSC